MLEPRSVPLRNSWRFLDLWAPELGFVAPEARDKLLMGAGLAVPPTLHRGRIEGVDQVEALLGYSRGGSEPMEGAVVRALDGSEPRIAKVLRAGLSRPSDAEWRRGRPRNALRERELLGSAGRELRARVARSPAPQDPCLRGRRLAQSALSERSSPVFPAAAGARGG